MGKTKDKKKAIESLKEQIEEHMQKLESDLQIPANRMLYSYYHFKETIRSMLLVIKKTYEEIGQKEQGEIVFKAHLARLENILRKYNCLEEYKSRYLRDFGEYP